MVIQIRNSAYSNRTHNGKGFTLIELMIVVSIIAVLMALALPVYSNYAIRAKIGESLSVANSAKTAVSIACIENRNLSAINNEIVGYGFQESTSGSQVYVQDIQSSGACTDPLITIRTKQTGQIPEPTIYLQGQLLVSSGKFSWRCYSTNTPNWLLPKTCRS